MRPEDQERAVVEVTARVVSRIEKQADKGNNNPTVEEILQEALYYERRRLEQGGHPKTFKQDKVFWKNVQKLLPKASKQEQLQLLNKVVDFHAREIVGHFDPRVYALATSVVPVGLSLLLNAMSPKAFLRAFPSFPDVTRNVVLQGEVDALRRMHELGTVILVPTHSSNLDSIVLGWSLYAAGLPPFTYGAGINLFINPVLSFFMHNLGAYTVDRLKKHKLYKDTLKEYCTLSIEYGYDNLFFPGGTRSRSGGVEQKLKLGLLGSGLKAYLNNVKANRPDHKVFIVPCTLNYHLVLEAETLIDDHLKEVGKSRYIIIDDEFSKPRRVASFMSGVLSLDSKIFVRFARPLDPFGNLVDDDGVSMDSKGRAVDISRYLMDLKGEPVEDPQRDEEYTRELGRILASSYMENNVLCSTHVLAFALFGKMAKENPGMELYRLLRTGGRTESVTLSEVRETIDNIIGELRRLDAIGKVKISETLATGDSAAVIAEALRHFGTYHTKPAAIRRGDRLFPLDRNLLYYYHNRALGYDLEV
ncbi:MAG: hypothetical protein GXP49_05755 [Deltaproteobacteria bacterium]|nr:hypothetical protein [Deltaproteobacteria bacterium]